MTALLAALLVESAHWVQLRWDFNETAMARAWQLTTIIIAISSLFIWLEGNRFTALPRILIGLPAMLLPMQFIQSYGMRTSIPLTAFSFFANRRRKRNLKLGLEDQTIHFHFGNVLFFVILVSATLGADSTMVSYFPGLIILGLWALLSITGSRRWQLVVVFCLAAVLSLGGQYGLGKAYKYLTRSEMRDRSGDTNFDPNFNQTAMGSLGELKQSKKIVWRVTVPPGGQPPPLLRTASYDVYQRETWKNRRPPQVRRSGGDFKDLTMVGNREEEFYFILHDPFKQSAISSDLPRYQLRGEAYENTPLPIPGETSSLKNFDLDGIEKNSMGTVRVFPKKSVIEGTVLWKGGDQPDSAPNPESLVIPPEENEVIQQIARQLNLAGQPNARAKATVIRNWLQNNFQYTRYLSIPRFSAKDKSTTISRFLTESKKGHCEYFATTGALLMRAAGVPTRYVIGYAVMEKDPKGVEYVVRGIHSHAWCRAWDEQTKQWFDFDPTPRGWITLDDTRTSWTQRFSDSFQRMREDFYLWRNRPSNRMGATVTIIVIGGSMTGFIAWRLWGTRSKVKKARGTSPGTEPMRRTPLNELESLARKRLGHRPPGLPLAVWLLSMPQQGPDLQEAIILHQRLRFDPEPPDDTSLTRLEELVKRLEKSFSAVR